MNDPTAMRTRSVRSLLITVLKLVITLVVLWYIGKKIHWAELHQAFNYPNILWFGAAMLLFALSGVVGAVQWRLLLRNRGIDVALRRAVTLYFMGMFFNNFMLGSAAADAVKVAYVKLDGQSGKAGLAATFLDRFAGLMALLGIALGGIGMLLVSRAETLLRITTVLVLVGCVLAVFTIASTILISRRIRKRVVAIFERVSLPGMRFVISLLEQAAVNQQDKRSVVQVLMLSLVIQLLRVGVHVCSGAMLGVLSASSVHYFLIFVPVLALLMIVPLPFGIVQGVEGSLFSLAGFNQGALVIGFIATAASICASLPGGLFFIVTRARTAGGKNNDTVTSVTPKG
jgi:uncharacterized protein (TIRG00374 family)